MLDGVTVADVGAALALLGISCFSFVVGMIFRRWPDKVRETVDGLDGFAELLSPQAHRAGIELAGSALVLLSLAALVAAALFL